jgi:hypothetical protein
MESVRRNAGDGIAGDSGAIAIVADAPVSTPVKPEQPALPWVPVTSLAAVTVKDIVSQ